MTKKIIVADDSQTIQKVIKISFASKGYELIPCLSEGELFKNASNSADLILLDFSLSETKNGYELAKLLREKTKTPIMALLGTFDTVDEASFMSSGYSDKIVKPFETEKFLKKCDALIENSGPLLSTDAQDTDKDSDYGGWGIDSPEINDETKPEREILKTSKNSPIQINSKLQQELGGWGFDKSELMARDLTNDYDEFPPVIESSSGIASKFLSANSLIEDDMGESLSLDTDEDLLEHDLTGEIVLSDVLTEEKTQEVNLFESTDVDAMDFWSVDESTMSTDFSLDGSEAVIEKVEPIVNEPIEFNYKVSAKEASLASAKSSHFSNEEMLNAIKADLAPIVEKYVKQYCEMNIEKIMWEIIPDLAENIIRKEIKEISKTVQSSIDN